MTKVPAAVRGLRVAWGCNGAHTVGGAHPAYPILGTRAVPAPCITRPSVVIFGEAMVIFRSCKRLLAFLLAALVAASAMAAGSDPAPNIVGGTVTSQYPSVGYVYMQFGSNGYGGCTGTAIAPRWVLTAAHCVPGATSFRFVVGSDVTQYVLSGGSNTSGLTVYNVDYATYAPSYNASTNAHDVGLLHLTTSVPAVEFKLDSRALTSAIVGSQKKIMGYGISNPAGGGSGDGVKRVATVAISALDANDIYSNYIATSSGTCEGDSGGPLYGFDTDGAPLMLGITSFGNTTICNSSGATGGFQRLDIELPYITSVVGRVCFDGESCAGIFGDGVCRVDASATGANDGTSWADAYVSLQSALGHTNCDQVWVAKGVYKPTAGVDQAASFWIPPGLAVYGGFAGTESQLAERVPGNVTVLSGDIDGDDAHHADTNIDLTSADIQGSNSHHVVVIDGTTTNVTASTVLDGFVITGGQAPNAGYPYGSGGGLACLGQSGHVCSPTLRRLWFSGNAAPIGGALSNDGDGGNSSPLLSDVTFSGNSAGVYGGAVYNDGNNGGVSSPILRNVTFRDNTAAQYGGAMFNDGYNGGHADPALSFVTFSGNSAGACGGALADNVGASPVLDHAILWGDVSPAGSEICDGGGVAVVTNSDVQGSGGSAGWNPDVGTDGGNNLDANPNLGSLRNEGSFTPTLALGAGSAAIDAATNCNDAANGPVAADQRGVPRPQGVACDIGAVESDRLFADGFEGIPSA